MKYKNYVQKNNYRIFELSKKRAAEFKDFYQKNTFDRANTCGTITAPSIIFFYFWCIMASLPKVFFLNKKDCL
jgi:hypothetical protein